MVATAVAAKLTGKFDETARTRLPGSDGSV